MHRRSLVIAGLVATAALLAARAGEGAVVLVLVLALAADRLSHHRLVAEAEGAVRAHKGGGGPRAIENLLLEPGLAPVVEELQRATTEHERGRRLLRSSLSELAGLRDRVRAAGEELAVSGRQVTDAVHLLSTESASKFNSSGSTSGLSRVRSVAFAISGTSGFSKALRISLLASGVPFLPASMAAANGLTLPGTGKL